MGRLHFFFILCKGLNGIQFLLGYVVYTKLSFHILFFSFQHHMHIPHRRDNDKQIKQL